ncbi:two-component system response regulator CreB [Hafnia paralvei]|uniref:two-component system response regulator CreB n=1 Tax=Hafnia paralvei TaxID=546367 RepID=UPI00107CA8EF|nr:two-component system response regulator CreB [Hafnia paralvei]
MSPTIWLVEDESSIADTLIYTLESEGFTVCWFERGLPVLEMMTEKKPDLVILDVGLPDINGFELCRKILTKSPDLPVLFLTARNDEVDRLIGLEIGADDYVAKPFSPREVCARVRTILRRSLKQNRLLNTPSSAVSIGPFMLDEACASISYHQQPLTLTRYEFLLLKTLLLAPGRVFSREQLMDIVWTHAEESLERTVDTHIKTLRAKLRAVNSEGNAIQTHRGLGYSLGYAS